LSLSGPVVALRRDAGPTIQDTSCVMACIRQGEATVVCPPADGSGTRQIASMSEELRTMFGSPFLFSRSSGFNIQRDSGGDRTPNRVFEPRSSRRCADVGILGDGYRIPETACRHFGIRNSESFRRCGQKPHEGRGVP
jgi:hypothetical protein